MYEKDNRLFVTVKINKLGLWSVEIYPASRSVSLAWPLKFTISFASLVSRAVGLLYYATDK